MSPITFSIIGASGWRAGFFLRIARELPERFRVNALMVRDPEKAKQLEKEWGIPTYTDLDSFLRDKPQFVVVSVSWPVAPVMLKELAERGIPALTETPPAPDVEGMTELAHLTRKGAKIQVAEQVQFRPLHAARISLANSGKLGRVNQAQVSVAHGYHGISLIRQYLNTGFENVTITARNFEVPQIKGPGREGLPATEETLNAVQTIATFDYGDRIGIFDFTSAQYWGMIRTPRTMIRGERGEIHDREVRYLEDFRTPIITEFNRQDAGQEDDLRLPHHEGILLGNEWIYRNPFAPARLSDDEIAVATCLQKMGEYVEGGSSFYGLEEGAQDHYLNLLMGQAVKSGQPVTSETQAWAEG